LAAHVGGSVGLEVERLELAGGAVEVEQDAALGLAKAVGGGLAGGGGCFGAPQVRGAQAEPAEATGSQRHAAGASLPQRRGGTQYAQHLGVAPVAGVI